MAKGKKGSLKAKILTSLGVIIVAITALWGYNHYMAEQKVNNLYKHGFRLLEEQIATYIVENYSGVSKVEFSPIFINGDGKVSMQTANVVPVIHDKFGNKAYLGRVIRGEGFSDFGLFDGLHLDFDVSGKEIIELESFDDNKIYDVSDYHTLPDFAKLESNSILDENLKALVKDSKVKDIKKSSNGSPKAKIIYNIEIRRGDYNTWR